MWVLRWVVVVVVVVVAGCGGDGGGSGGVLGAVRVVEPEPLELPEYPSDLELVDSADNAVRAAEYFIELMNYTQSTGDVGPYEEVAASGCGPCEGFVEAIEELYGPGGFLVGTAIELTNITAKRSIDGLAWEVTADFHFGDGLRYRGSERGGAEYVEGATFPGLRIGAYLQDGQWWMLVLIKARKGES